MSRAATAFAITHLSSVEPTPAAAAAADPSHPRQAQSFHPNPPAMIPPQIPQLPPAQMSTIEKQPTAILDTADISAPDPPPPAQQPKTSDLPYPVPPAE